MNRILASGCDENHLIVLDSILIQDNRP